MTEKRICKKFLSQEIHTLDLDHITLFMKMTTMLWKLS